MEGQLQQYPRNLCLLIEISNQLTHLAEAEFRREQVDLLHVDIILLHDAFKLLVVFLLGDVMLQKLMQLEPDSNFRRKGYLLLDVRERSGIEADVDYVQLGHRPPGVLAVEQLILLALGCDLLLYV